MRVYLRAKVHVSSIILTNFRQGKKKPLKSPSRLRLKKSESTILFSTFWLSFLALEKSDANIIWKFENILRLMLRLNFLYLNFCTQPAYCCFHGPFGNLGISISIDGIGIKKNLFCLSKFSFLPFDVSFEVKNPWLHSFQIHLQAFLDV